MPQSIPQDSTDSAPPLPKRPGSAPLPATPATPRAQLAADSLEHLPLDLVTVPTLAHVPYVPHGPHGREHAHEDTAIRERLLAGLGNSYRGSVHNCYKYAWAVVEHAGGHDVDHSKASTSSRGQPLSHLKMLSEHGLLRPGDVVYADYHPGSDPDSIDLSDGPHWFVYVGRGKYADQYGVQTLQSMENMIPGRRIDTIFRPFPDS